MAGGGLRYLTQVIIAQWLGLGQFGIFSYAWAWVNLIAIFACLGLPVSSARSIPQHRAQRSWTSC